MSVLFFVLLLTCTIFVKINEDRLRSEPKISKLILCFSRLALSLSKDMNK